jgi:hypothetical protein
MHPQLVPSTLRRIGRQGALLAIACLLATQGRVQGAEGDADSAVNPSSRQSRPSLPALSPGEAARKLNRLLDVPQRRHVDDATFLRRAYFDTVGLPPTAKTVRDFLDDKQSNKRTSLVAELLADPRYGQNWGQYWCDVIMYRRSEDRALRAAPTLTKYLAESLNQDKPWDALASSFITATGDVQERGETGLITAQAGRPEETVSEISRIFLGVQIQCAQCHDHFTDSWTRDQFHELAAFFPRTALRPVRNGDKRSFVVTSVNKSRRRKPKANMHYGAAEHYMPDLDDPKAKGTLMTPKFFLNDEQLELGTDDLSRRNQLAQWITESEWFAKSLVNRIWTDLNGSGFYSTVDDIGPERDCEQEEAFEFLADQFVANDHDLKWLIQTITATDVYQSPSESRVDDGSWGPTRNHPIRLRSDQLFNSVTQLFGGQRPLSREQRKFLQKGARLIFAAHFGFDPSVPQADIDGSVPQALLMMNSKIIDRQLQSRKPGGIGSAIRDLDDDRKLVEYLYLRCLSRRPSKPEIKTALNYVASSENRTAGFHDLIWSLVNCSEFMHRG